MKPTGRTDARQLHFMLLRFVQTHAAGCALPTPTPTVAAPLWPIHWAHHQPGERREIFHEHI